MCTWQRGFDLPYDNKQSEVGCKTRHELGMAWRHPILFKQRVNVHIWNNRRTVSGSLHQQWNAMNCRASLSKLGTHMKHADNDREVRDTLTCFQTTYTSERCHICHIHMFHTGGQTYHTLCRTCINRLTLPLLPCRVILVLTNREVGSSQFVSSTCQLLTLSTQDTRCTRWCVKALSVRSTLLTCRPHVCFTLVWCSLELTKITIRLTIWRSGFFNEVL